MRFIRHAYAGSGNLDAPSVLAPPPLSAIHGRGPHYIATASLAILSGDALTDLLAGLAANSIGSFERINSAAGFSSRLVHDRHLTKPGMTNSPTSFNSL